MKAKVLIVDDDPTITTSLRALLESENYVVFDAATGGDALAALKGKAREPDIILLDVQLPDFSGIDLIEKMVLLSADSQILMITAHGSVPQSVEAMRRGAVDYILKPFSIDELLLRLKRAREGKKLKVRVDYLSSKVRSSFEEKFVCGPNIVMQKIYQGLEKIAQSKSSTVLIRGETGAGKEHIAHRVHELSCRRDAPFVEINATALTAELLESELFGHEAGSFTGALKAKKGLFEIADGGTLFLDEIGDMDLAMQAKILRALQERKIRRVGGVEYISVDIRLITATNCDLEKAVKEGEFREDLYYRLNVVPIQLPPLRARADDLQSLVMHFIKKFSAEFGKQIDGVADDVLLAFKQYRWPGNIRELSNIIERALLLECESEGCLELKHLSFFNGGATVATSSNIGQNIPLEIVEREHIEGVLKANNGNKHQAAQILKIDRTTLYNKLKKYSK